MDAIDISDLAFSLTNFAAANDIISTTDPVSSSVSNSVSEIVSSALPEDPKNIIEPVNNFINEVIDSEDNDYSFIYLGLGIIIILVGVFVYNYYTNKNKQVQFKDPLDYEEEGENFRINNNYRQSEF